MMITIKEGITMIGSTIREGGEVEEVIRVNIDIKEVIEVGGIKIKTDKVTKGIEKTKTN
jgi:hypothetical protein